MSYKPTIIDAIISLKADAKVIIKDEDYDTIVWEDGNPTNITQEQIETKLVELITEYDAQDYARKRKAEYPSLVDQLDDIYHNGIDGWKATIKITKDKYPKS
tara:strand:- start:749 stop:1054 length:306 start_codon:yes stop_codon:yes gene_type:complete